MKKFTLSIMVALIVLPAIASAGVDVGYDATCTKLTYSNDGTLMIEDTDTVTWQDDNGKWRKTPGTTLSVGIFEDGLLVEGVALGQYPTNKGGSGILFDGDLVGDSTNGYSVTGSLKIWDYLGGDPKIDALFTSTSVAIVTDGTGSALEIRGMLRGDPDTESILRPTVDPWVFTGEPVVGVPGENYSFAVEQNTETYTDGYMLSIQFAVTGQDTLESLFGDDMVEPTTVISGGELKGEVVPAPAAVALAGMGLGLVGLIKRRFGK